METVEDLSDVASEPEELLPPSKLLRAIRTDDREAVGLMRPAEWRDKDGATALHVAAKLGSTKVVRQLVESRAACDAVDKAGQTALHYAAKVGNAAAAEAMLSHVPNWLDREFCSAADLARQSGHAELASKLERLLPAPTRKGSQPQARPWTTPSRSEGLSFHDVDSFVAHWRPLLRARHPDLSDAQILQMALWKWPEEVRKRQEQGRIGCRPLLRPGARGRPTDPFVRTRPSTAQTRPTQKGKEGRQLSLSRLSTCTPSEATPSSNESARSTQDANGQLICAATKVIAVSSSVGPTALPSRGQPLVFAPDDQDQWCVVDLGHFAVVSYVSSEFCMATRPGAVCWDASVDGQHWRRNAFGVIRGAPTKSPVGSMVDRPVRARYLRYRFGPRHVLGGASVSGLHAQGHRVDRAPCVTMPADFRPGERVSVRVAGAEDHVEVTAVDRGVPVDPEALFLQAGREYAPGATFEAKMEGEWKKLDDAEIAIF